MEASRDRARKWIALEANSPFAAHDFHSRRRTGQDLSPGRRGPRRSRAGKRPTCRGRPNPGSSDGSAIHTLARLEPASGVIAVGARPGARIETIQVKEGDEVKPGDTLAILEGHEEAVGRLALAEAQLKSADRIRSLQKDKLALERKQYDALKVERLKAARRASELNAQKLQELKLVDSKLVQALGNDARAKLDVGQAIYQLEIASLKASLDLKGWKPISRSRRSSRARGQERDGVCSRRHRARPQIDLAPMRPPASQGARREDPGIPARGD